MSLQAIHAQVTRLQPTMLRTNAEMRRSWRVLLKSIIFLLVLATAAMLSFSGAFAQTPPADRILSIYVLGLDNDLTSHEYALFSAIVQGTQVNTRTVAVVLSDLIGEGNTTIRIVEQGNISTIQGLPDLAGELQTNLLEYNIADGETLGGFLRWARNNYPAAKTLLTIATHGLPLAPSTDHTVIFTGTAPAARGGTDTQLFPLPTQCCPAHPELSDRYPKPSLITPYDLGVALKKASDDGRRKLTVVDLVACFGATIENLYEIADYTEAIIASANYTYLNPAGLGDKVRELLPTMDARTLAGKTAAAHDRSLATQGHPHVVVAVESGRLEAVKTAWDALSNTLSNQLNQDRLTTQANLRNAYRSTRRYDTTYCEGDWSMENNDALVDMADFADALSNVFAGTPVAANASTAKQSLTAAITVIYRRTGNPWFAASQNWTFDERNAGIALYADLLGNQYNNQSYLYWAARFYTTTVSSENPHPYRFILPTAGGKSWADVFQHFWEGASVQTEACLPAFPLELSSLRWQLNPANNHAYAVTPCGSWEDCQKLVATYQNHKQLDTHLVTIGDMAEQQWLSTTLGTDEPIWIGLTQRTAQGNWAWKNGEPLIYQNWDENQPQPIAEQWFGVINGRRGNSRWSNLSNNAPQVQKALLETICTFQAADTTTLGKAIDCVNAAGGGVYTITLTSNIVLTDTLPTLNNPLPSAIVIRGNDVIVDGNGRWPPFTIADNTTVYFEQVMLESRDPPTQPLRDAVKVAVGSYHTCILTNSSTVKCWGLNNAGQLGDGTTINRSTPTTVIGLSNDVIALAAGSYHTCALTRSGAVKCWGRNWRGELGDGTSVDRTTPVMVSGLNSNVTMLTASNSHTCALTSVGAALCWGRNDSGQLGDGTTTNRNTPVTVSGLSNNVSALATGNYHTCGLTSAGALLCWGDNSSGQLGDGTTTNRITPVTVSGLNSDVTAVVVGDKYSCALTHASIVLCWGGNWSGQLGDGTLTERHTPRAVYGLSSDAMALAAGDWYACALTYAGLVSCWGNNDYGQLGDGTVTSRNLPGLVNGLSSDVIALVAGDFHTCALTRTGAATCWGANQYAQLGNAKILSSHIPVAVRGLSNDVRGVATGTWHTCSLGNNGGVTCWGRNGIGQLGSGTTTPYSIPVAVSGLPSGVAAIAAGHQHTCALTNAGAVWCWGWNWGGQLGDDTNRDRYLPVIVNGLESSVTAIATGYQHTCALTNGGAVWCWGFNGHGQLGDGTNIQRYRPVAVSGLSSGVIAIAAGYERTCALTNSGAVLCWGRNDSGQLGDGTTINRNIPTPVSGLTSGVSTVSTGYYHTCALTNTGMVMCWGGKGTTPNLTPVPVSKLNGIVRTVAVGYDHICALTIRGGAKCWGLNNTGQLGDGTYTYRVAPVQISGVGGGATAIATGGYHTCALTTQSGIKCWGSNEYGQLGNGEPSWLPVTVVEEAGIGAPPPPPTSTPAPTATAMPTLTPTATPSPTSTATNTPTATPSDTATATPTATPSPTMTPPTPTATSASAAIMIVQDSLPDNQRQNFNFSGTGVIGRFTLDDVTPDDGDAYPNAKTLTVAPGVYNVTIAAYASWTLAGITCTPEVNHTVDLSRRRVTIRIQANQQIRCTFVNQLKATVNQLVYHDLNNNRAFNSGEPGLPGWNLYVYDGQGGQVLTKMTDELGQANLLRQLIPGAYTFCQEMVSGWTNRQPGGALHPIYGKACFAPHTLAPGQTLTIRFGNIPAGIAGASDEAAGINVGEESVIEDAWPDSVSEEDAIEEAQESDPADESASPDAPIQEAAPPLNGTMLYLPVIMVNDPAAE